MKKFKVLLVGIIVLIIAVCSFEKNNDEKETKLKVAIIGDSISAGCNPELATSEEKYEKRYGYAQMLAGETYEGITSPAKNIYTIWENAEFKNYSIIGSRASEWNKDSSNSTKWHTWDREFKKVLDFTPDVAVIYLGANDIFAYIGNDGKITSEEYVELRKNIMGIIDQLKSKNSKVKIVLIGYYDMFDGLSSVAAKANTAFLGFGDMSTIVVEGNEMIKEIAAIEGATYVDTYKMFLNHGYGKALGNAAAVDPFYLPGSLSTFDIHPITDGHKAIYEKVYSALESIK